MRPIFLLGLLLPAQAFAQYPPKLVAELTQLRDGALSSDYAYARLAHLSHNIGPRLSGSPQAAKAVEYVAGELSALGLEVSLEKVVVPHWVRGKESAELTAYPGQAPGTAQKVALTALGGSVATPEEGLSADVVVVHSMDELTALGKDKVQGKIVLFDVRFDKKKAEAGRSFDAYEEVIGYRGQGATAAAKLGAVASLLRSLGSADFRLPHTGGVRYSTATARPIPAAAVAAEDAELIADLAAQGAVRLHLVLTPQTLPDVESYNVIADLKGSEHPEQVVLVSGHLDSWDLATGSIDDGAGVVMAMQAVRLAKAVGRPKRTIRFAAWMNEENGNRGGRTYAADHKADAKDHVVVMECDSGAGHALGYEGHMSSAALAMFEPLVPLLAPMGAGTVTHSEEPVEVDITPMQELGVPGMTVSNDTRAYFHYHHTAADTLDKVAPRELQENAAVLATLAWAAANMADVLPR